MKKILIFTHEFPPRLGGAGGVALQLADYFTAKNYDVTVLTKKRKSTAKYPFKLIEIAILGKLWFVSYFIFLKTHNIRQYDYIILNDAGAIYSAGLALSNTQLNKSIVYIHGMEKYLEEKSFFLKVLRFKRVYLEVLEQSRKMISVSDYIKNRFLQNDLAKFLDKTTTIYNGVDTKQFYYAKNDIYGAFALSQNITKLLTVGRFVKEKGFLKKLEIFEELLLKDKNYVWFIIGDGAFKNEFNEIIKTKKLDNKIFLLGAKSKDELKYYYSNSDLFWLLSTFGWVETFGLVYFEAMACKCIPIAWNDKGPKEVIKNNITGCLANSNEEVIKFIQTGYKNIDRDNLPNQVIKVEESYQGVLSD